MAQARFCAECGVELVPGAKFCAACGTPVGAAPAADDAPGGDAPGDDALGDATDEPDSPEPG